MTDDSLRAICVFCGASPRVEARYFEEAKAAGALIAKAGKRLVYGGGRRGLMGAAAEGALSAGGQVTGVMPEFLLKVEALHTEIDETHIVRTMHERQAMMQDLADAFLILPGGLGTLAELFEVVTWKQLGQHQKPAILLNSFGYWDKMLDFLAYTERENFTYKNNADLWQVADTLEAFKSILGLR